MSDAPIRPTDTAARSDYWENIHATREMDAVSWWQSVPGLSLGLVDRSGVGSDQPIIDVGAGSSTLTDHLLERGFADLTAVDLSSTALQHVRTRIGAAGDAVVFEVADVLELDLGRRYALWHDRAVFHFLTERRERDAYRASLERAIEPDGWLVVATFGPDGPTQCSGLPIVRYSHEQLAAEFPGFDLVETMGEDHLTPSGGAQQFTAVLMRHRSR